MNQFRAVNKLLVQTVQAMPEPTGLGDVPHENGLPADEDGRLRAVKPGHEKRRVAADRFEFDVEFPLGRRKWCGRIQRLGGSMMRPGARQPNQKLEIKNQQFKLAEGVGFEPTRAFALPVFKTGAINHSTTPPRLRSFTRLGDGSNLRCSEST